MQHIEEASRTQPLVQYARQPGNPPKSKAKLDSNLCKHARWRAEMIKMTDARNFEVQEKKKPRKTQIHRG